MLRSGPGLLPADIRSAVVPFENSITPALVATRSAVCGGLAQWDHVHQSTPTAIREAARAAIHETNGRRLILSTGCNTLITSPLSNLRAVREAVE